jgi:hypothetical protein
MSLAWTSPASITSDHHTSGSPTARPDTRDRTRNHRAMQDDLVPGGDNRHSLVKRGPA